MGETNGNHRSIFSMRSTAAPPPSRVPRGRTQMAKSIARFLVAVMAVAAMALASVAGTGPAQAQTNTPTDRDALVTLYNATSGGGWANNDNWLSDKPLGEWHGVDVDDSGGVVRLSLGFNELAGPIPAELGSLSNLETLYLGFNELAGPIPAELGSLSNLESLNLSSNELTGIPGELGNLPNLETLYLGFNELAGPIPGELGNLSNLETLYLGFNELAGPIPAELGSLSNLKSLNLSNNRLTGTIPAELGSLSNLESLNLSSNELTGIPGELGNLPNLETLYLGFNELAGPIPAELGSLSNLETLYLGFNELAGTIPAELGSLSNLESLNLSSNELTGIPGELGNLPNLETLYLGFNELAGPIPGELGNLSNLETLYLGFNELAGPIPAELGSLSNLETLYLGFNELAGPIPGELGNLSNLETLYLGFNELAGPIPAELGSLSNLKSLNLSNNRLTGTIPAELGSLSNLERLSLSQNMLTGCVPEAWRDIAESDVLELGLPFCAVSLGTAPVFSDSEGNPITEAVRSVVENTAAGENVGAPVTAMDADNDTLTYSLGGTDMASFDIDPSTGQLMTKAALDYEAKASYVVTVTASDSGGLSDSIDVTITVTNVEELGMLTGNASDDYAENGTAAVETYTAAGPVAASWSLEGDDMGAFSIGGSSGELMFASPPDFEASADMGMDNMYQVTVKAEAGGEMDMIDVTITVTNVEEMGEVTLWAGTEALTMAPQVGDTITGAVMDPDGGVTGDTWQWAKTMDTANMSSWMDIQGATNAAYMVTAGDTGYYLRVMATYTDAVGTDMDMEYSMPTMMVTMMTIPMFDSETDTREVAENTEAGMDIGDPVTATDADGDTLTYALGGTDAASFAIDPATGQLMTLAALDFETKPTYSVTVTASDSGGLSDSIDVTITVTNVDEMGEVTLWAGTDPLTMAPQVGDTITGAVIDPDGGVTGESWQWAKTKTPAMMDSWMPITGATAAAYMVTEGDTGYHLRVMATYTDAAGTDMGYSPATMMVTTMMTVPMFESETAARVVAENTAAGMNIGDPVTAMDADDDTLIYALGGTDAASFYIDPETGQLKTLAALDYETKATYEVMVTATDPGGLSDSIDVTITVTDVDEDVAPVDPLVDKYDANENGEIERAEVFAAIDDYLDGRADAPTRADVFKLIEFYLGD